MKHYTIIHDCYGDGWKLIVKVHSPEGVKELEDAGYYFDDFAGAGKEVWKKG